MRLYDFHRHSSFSDGCKPREIFESANQFGITDIAVTDHNNIAFHLDDEIKELSIKHNIRTYMGCEFMVKSPYHKYHFEILGLFFNVDNNKFIMNNYNHPRRGDGDMYRICKDVSTVVNNVHEHGGICILCHPTIITNEDPNITITDRIFDIITLCNLDGLEMAESLMRIVKDGKIVNANDFRDDFLDDITIKANAINSNRSPEHKLIILNNTDSHSEYDDRDTPFLQDNPTQIDLINSYLKRYGNNLVI